MDSTKKPRPLLAIAGVLVLAIIAVYGQLRGHDAIHFDDNVLVTQNPIVQGGISWTNLKWAFATPILGIWHPLTTLTHMLDCQLYGLDIGMHHVTSVVLHVASTLVLLYLLHRMTGAVWRPALAAALFALHPLNVESVAWIAERKNVLSTLFWLLTTLSYVAWVQQRSAARYVLTLVLFAAGLMSKPMLVTLPCALLLLDYWPLQRMSRSTFGRLVVEKLPFFALSAAGSLLTYALQQDVVEAGVREIPIPMRIATPVLAYAAYLRDMVWPHDLAVLYPIEGWLDARALLVASLALLAITFLAVRSRASAPYFITGWLWYLGTLVPVVGIVHVGSQTRADRYVYVPMIGVFVAIAWSLGTCAERWPRARIAIVACAIAAVAALGALAARQAARWKNSITLFEYTLTVTPNNLIIHNALGVALVDVGRHEDAIVQFNEALRLKPDSPGIRESLGLSYASSGHFAEAEQCFRDVIASEPGAVDSRAALGLVLTELGRNDEALEQFREAVRLDPQSGQAQAGLGALLVTLGKHEEALPHLRAALALNPRFAQTHTSLGLALASRGDFDGAIESFQRSLALVPGQPRVLGFLGTAYSSKGRPDDAIARFTEAVKLDPRDVEMKSRLADALASRGEVEPALKLYAEALAQHPKNAMLHYNLGVVLARQGKVAAAVREFEECVRLDPSHVRAHSQLGVAASAAGQPDRAIEHYRAALRGAPDDPQVLMSLAWILATSETAAVRNGAEAVRLAGRASELLGGQNAGALATLAAALAEDGKFDEAATTVGRALNLARMNGQRDLVATLEESLRKYQAGERMYSTKPAK